jgi:hypothetical protein
VEAAVVWRTGQSGAPATSPGRWVLTVGDSDSWATKQSGGAPDSTVHCLVRLLAPVLTSAHAGAHCSAFIVRCRQPLALCSRYSAGAPDIPVNYSGAATRIPEGGEFEVGFPGAPDTVRWCTGHCPMAHRTVWCARLGHTSVVFFSFYLNTFLVFLLVCCEPLEPVELII